MVFAIKGLTLIYMYRMNHLIMVCHCSELVVLRCHGCKSRTLIAKETRDP